MWDAHRRPLEKKFRLVTPDLPGFGKKRSMSAASVGAMARFVAQELKRLKVDEPVFIAGLSMGGYIALEFARLYPQKVRALGLFATRSTPDSPEARKKRFESIALVKREGPSPLTKAMLPKLLGATSLRSRPSVVRATKRILASASAAGVIGALRAMAARRDNTAVLRKLKRPVLILAGKEDVIIPAEEIAHMKKAAKKSTLVRFPRAGHLLNLESPETFQSVLSKFRF